VVKFWDFPIEMAGHPYNRAGATAQPVMVHRQFVTMHLPSTVMEIWRLRHWTHGRGHGKKGGRREREKGRGREKKGNGKEKRNER